MSGNDAFEHVEERCRTAGGHRIADSRWSWLLSRPQTPEQVAGTAAASAGGALLTGLLLGRGAGSALVLAAGFGGTTLVVQAVKYRRWDRQGRPDDPPPTRRRTSRRTAATGRPRTKSARG